MNIETLLVGVYAYFIHNRKRNLEKSKLVEVMEIKGLKIFMQHQNQMDSHGCSKQGGPRKV